MNVPFSQASQSFILPGPAGGLEVMTTIPENTENSVVAIICHPHPLHKGTMRNKVVTTLYKAFDGLSCKTVRFNFRGVGKSEGAYGQMTGEIDDLKAVLAWVKEMLPEHTLWLSGFSFGGYIAASVANQDPSIKQLVTIAPAVNHADFSALSSIACPWLMVHGEADEVVPFKAAKAFASTPPVPLTFIAMPETTHFFHGRLVQLREKIVDYMNKS